MSHNLYEVLAKFEKHVGRIAISFYDVRERRFCSYSGDLLAVASHDPEIETRMGVIFVCPTLARGTDDAELLARLQSHCNVENAPQPGCKDGGHGNCTRRDRDDDPVSARKYANFGRVLVTLRSEDDTECFAARLIGMEYTGGLGPELPPHYVGDAKFSPESIVMFCLELDARRLHVGD